MNNPLESEFLKMEIDTLNRNISYFKNRIRNLVVDIEDGEFESVEDILKQLNLLIGAEV